MQKIDPAGDWGTRLAQIDVATDFSPWRLGVVLEVSRQDILVGLRPVLQQNGQLPKDREAVKIASMADPPSSSSMKAGSRSTTRGSPASSANG